MQQPLRDVQITGGSGGDAAGFFQPRRRPPSKCPKRRGNEVAEEAGDRRAECLR
jgi:hypothetical protein